MLTFRKYFYLLENDGLKPFNGAPPTKLGFHNTVRDLPDNKPYGFWVDKHGNFIVVGFGSERSHNAISRKVYNRMCLLMKIPFEGSAISDSYKFMLDNGCIRVVNEYRIYYSTYAENQVTSSQIKFLNFVKDLYNMSPEIQFDPYA